jgi:hypothetical protein
MKSHTSGESTCLYKEGVKTFPFLFQCPPDSMIPLQ